MKQVLREGLKKIVVTDVPDPQVIPHHVLIRPRFSLISAGTETADLHQDGVLKEVADNPSHLRKVWEVMKVAGPTKTVSEVRAKFNEYAALGYSGAGVVVEKHETVRDIEVGDRVAYGGEGTGHAETVIAGRNLIVKIPDEVPFEHACFTTLGSIAMNAVRIGSIAVGDVVAVIGLGLIGQLVSQLVRAQGGVVVAIDMKSDRVELARQGGADFGLQGGSSVTEEVLALTDGRGADCVIVAAAAKTAAPVQQAIKICRDRGRLVIVGAMPLDLPRDQMYVKELQLFMARAYGPGSYDPLYEKQGRDYPFAYVRWTENRNMGEFLRLIARGQVRIESLISHRFELDDAADAYQTIMNPSKNSLGVLLRYHAASEAQDNYKPERRLNFGKAAPKNGDLRIALIGAGNLAKWEHLPNIKKISGVKLHAVHSSNGARGKSYAERFGASYSTSSYNEILSDPDVDIILIATRHQYHFDQAYAALAAGKHVFIEKPMALTQTECVRLCKKVEDTGLFFTVGFNRRFSPYYLEQKKIVQQRVGPAVVSCRMNSPGLSGSFWAADPMHGGAVVGEGCHFIDLMYWMLESEPVKVSAYSLPTDRQDPIGQNNVAAVFNFQDGSVASLVYCTVGTKTSQGERLEIFAPGVAVTNENFKELTIKGNSQRVKSQRWPDKGYAAQMAAFVGDIRAGKQPEVTVRDGARATIVCVRLLESARTRQPLTIDLDAVLG